MDTATPLTGGGARRVRWLALALAVLIADLGSKWAIFYPHVLDPGFREGKVVGELTSWWRLILVYNTGITFGSFSGSATWLLGLVTGGVIAVLVYQLWTAPADARVRSFALSIIIGGAAGNLYDRALRPLIEPDKHPGVRDFLDWYAPDHWGLADWLREHDMTTHWYTSNVADVCIVVGVFLLAGCILTEKDPDEASAEDSTASEPEGSPSA